MYLLIPASEHVYVSAIQYLLSINSFFIHLTTDDSLNRAVEADAVRNSGVSDQIPQGEKKDGVAPKDSADGAENKTTPKNNRGGSEPGSSVPPAVPGNAAPLEHHEHVDDSGLIDTEDKIFISRSILLCRPILLSRILRGEVSFVSMAIICRSV